MHNTLDTQLSVHTSEKMCDAKIMGRGVNQMCDLPDGECALGVMGSDWSRRGVHIRVKRPYADGRLRSSGLGDLSQMSAGFCRRLTGSDGLVTGNGVH